MRNISQVMNDFKEIRKSKNITVAQVVDYIQKETCNNVRARRNNRTEDR